MAVTFKKATKEKARARVCLVGPSGSGKTYSGLALATNLGKKVAVIDTEYGSASKYASIFSFDSAELTRYSPEDYCEAIKTAEDAGYDCILIDSLSPVWSGAGGALEMVDSVTKRSQSSNSYTAWRSVTPVYDHLFVDVILGCKAHVVATLRSKVEYVIEQDSRGKSAPKKVGLAPIIRDGSEYYFDVVGTLTQDNECLISKSRCPELFNKVIYRPGKEMAEVLSAWLTDGCEVPAIKSIEDLFSEVADLDALKALAKMATDTGEYERNRVIKAFATRKAEIAALQSESLVQP